LVIVMTTFAAIVMSCIEIFFIRNDWLYSNYVKITYAIAYSMILAITITVVCSTISMCYI
jgi:uncharacterized membrane protein YfbV (UPF0208 family)